ncbi:hypothetical protein QC764_0075760 [Podospora pseudoanserina]|uniref:Uncharacterized protein n=1 Tax=Podospora pseudoanserina TaxID=2609844 RepID=A0ABR0I4Z6_9PEZI|nr:hypothetical protein QC764_0075760 [Podospora pseudoanserina]
MKATNFIRYKIPSVMKKSSENHADNTAAGMHGKDLQRVMSKEYFGFFFQEVDAKGTNNTKHWSAPDGNLNILDTGHT